MKLFHLKLLILQDDGKPSNRAEILMLYWNISICLEL